MELWTIGHSTRTFDTFVDILRKHRIETVVDVRQFPDSKRMPWFRQEFLKLMLPKYRISYAWLGKTLGWYRKGGYAAHTKTKEFAAGLQQLADIALVSKAAVMCAESEFFRCHRRYIADAFAANSWTVTHIYDETRVQRHETQASLHQQ